MDLEVLLHSTHDEKKKPHTRLCVIPIVLFCVYDIANSTHVLNNLFTI